MDEHHSFMLKGIDQPEPLDVSISAKTIRCATFKVSHTHSLIVIVHEHDKIILREYF